MGRKHWEVWALPKPRGAGLGARGFQGQRTWASSLPQLLQYAIWPRTPTLDAVNEVQRPEAGEPGATRPPRHLQLGKGDTEPDLSLVIPHFAALPHSFCDGQRHPQAPGKPAARRTPATHRAGLPHGVEADISSGDALKRAAKRMRSRLHGAVQGAVLRKRWSPEQPGVAAFRPVRNSEGVAARVLTGEVK